MSRLNKIILIGDVSSAPTSNLTNSGDSVTNFKLTVNRPENESGQSQQDVFTIISWRELSEKASALQENTRVLVEGSIRNRSYENNEGQRIYVTEIESYNLSVLSENQAPHSGANSPVVDPVEQISDNEPVFDFNEAIKTESNSPDFSSDLGKDVPF